MWCSLERRRRCRIVGIFTEDEPQNHGAAKQRLHDQIVALTKRERRFEFVPLAASAGVAHPVSTLLTRPSPSGHSPDRGDEVAICLGW